MSNITAALVKELRERTGAGMMECKKALVETNGDIEAAIENMRVNGQAKAAKKASRTAAEGVVLSRFADNGKKGYIVELNCETDFVAKDSGFLELANKVADYVKANDTTDLEAVKAAFETERAALVAKIGENMTIRRIQALEGSFVGGYNHGSKISVLVAVSTENADLAKKLGMHVASSRPEYTFESEIPAAALEKELNVQKEIAAEDADFQKKPANIQEKILEGRMNNFKKEVTLTLQPFVVDPSVDVKTFLAQEKATVEGFVRLEVGEGIVKEEEDFAAEVAKVTGSFQ